MADVLNAAAGYKCTDIGCYDYQSSAMHDNIVALQGAINRFSDDQSYGFAPITRDGIIGQGCFIALGNALSAIQNSMGPDGQNGLSAAAASYMTSFNTNEDVVQNAGPLAGFLNSAADSLGETGSSTGPIIPTSPSTIPAPRGAQAAQAIATTIATKPGIKTASSMPYGLSSTVVYAGGGILIAALMFLGYKRKKG